MQRAHACRGRRGSSRERPRQLRLAQRLVRAAHALQPPSGCRESSALLGAARAMQSRRARRLTPASKSAQPADGRGCADILSASWRPPQRDCIKHGAAPESSPRSTIDFTPAGPPLMVCNYYTQAQNGQPQRRTCATHRPGTRRPDSAHFTPHPRPVSDATRYG